MSTTPGSNPWSEKEAGHHYTRSLSSFGLITAMLGFSADLGRETVTFDPKFTEPEFSCFWSHGQGWGTYTQRANDSGKLTAEVCVIEGTLGAATIKAPVPVQVVGTNA